MKCNFCNGSIVNNCCTKCGKLINGEKIDLKKDNMDKYYLQKKFNKNFDIMHRNEKLYINFFLGPLYYSYRGHIILGILSVFIDVVLFWFVGTFINVSLILSSLFLKPMLFILYFVCNRIVYMGFANPICLLIDNIRIKQILKKENGMKKLESYKHRKSYLFLTLMFYLTIIVFFAIFRRIKNGIL